MRRACPSGMQRTRNPEPARPGAHRISITHDFGNEITVPARNRSTPAFCVIQSQTKPDQQKP